MNKIRVKSKLSSKRNREDDIIELIQEIIECKVDSQMYLQECGYCCKCGSFGPEFAESMHEEVENICDKYTCTNCHFMYLNFVAKSVAQELCEEYEVDLEKVLDGVQMFEEFD